MKKYLLVGLLLSLTACGMGESSAPIEEEAPYVPHRYPPSHPRPGMGNYDSCGQGWIMTTDVNGIKVPLPCNMEPWHEEDWSAPVENNSDILPEIAPVPSMET